MGWLRDLMQAASPPVRSFGKLADAMRLSADWPTDFRVQARSLATLLSRLDRGLDLAWLAERPAAQLAIARVLQVSPDEVKRGIGEPPRSDSRTFKLRVLPSARPIDLALEALPPGIPKILQGHLEQPLFWVAPSGSGRTLLGKWLEARGRAAFLEVPSLESLDPSAETPLFVEVTQPNSQSLPKPRRGLCLAGSFEPPRDSGFRVVRSPELTDILRPLLLWAAERLPKESRFDPNTAESVFLEKIESGWLEGIGSVLGAVGLVDEFGLRAFSAGSEERIAKRFVEARVAHSVSASLPYASWIRRHIYGALLAMVERNLVDSDTDLSAPQSFDAWLRLVPPELERHVDLEWMRLSMTQIDSGVRASDVERAARRLPPGAFRIVTTLEHAQLLVRVSNDELKLDPLWLVSALRRAAIEALLGRSAFEWGEALLRPNVSAQVAEALLTRTLAEGGSILASALDIEAEDQPAYAAAVDAALRVAGVARLLGHDLGLELLDGLVSETEALAIDFGNGLFEPRLNLAPLGIARTRHRRGQALLAPGTFYLALLSVSEALEHGAVSRLRALVPWRRTEPTSELKLAYDAIETALEDDPPWRKSVFSLIGRVRRVVGNVDGPDTPHALELPAQALEEIEHGVLSISTLRRAGPNAIWLDALLAIAKERGTEPAEVARSIWTAWDRAQRPDELTFLAPDAPARALFWGNLPGELLEPLLSGARLGRIPYDVFTEEQWLAFLRALARVPGLVTEGQAFLLLPGHLVPKTLEMNLDWTRSPESLVALWTRFPTLLLAAVSRELEKGARAAPERLNALLSTAPEAVTGELLHAFDEKKSLAPTTLVCVRALLRRTISARGPEWRAAYRRLSQLERELRRTQSASL